MAGEKAGLKLLLKIGPTPGISAQLKVQNLIFDHKTPGKAGNDVSIEFIDGATAGSETVSVTGSDIQVTIEDGVSTAEQIKFALDNDPDSYAILRTTYFGDRKIPQTIQPPINLAFGYDAVTYSRMIGALQGKTFNYSGEAIDVTSHRSDNYKEMLDEAGIRGWSLSGNGICTEDEDFHVLQQIAEKNLIQEFILVDISNKITRSGRFKIASFEEGAEYNAAHTYSLTMESSGRVVSNVSTPMELDETI